MSEIILADNDIGGLRERGGNGVPDQDAIVVRIRNGEFRPIGCNGCGNAKSRGGKPDRIIVEIALAQNNAGRGTGANFAEEVCVVAVVIWEIEIDLVCQLGEDIGWENEYPIIYGIGRETIRIDDK